MEITDIKIRKVETEGKLKAYVTITFDRCFVVHNVKVIDGRNGAFVAMPSRRTKSGEFKDVAHPISAEFRRVLEERVIAAYRAAETVLPEDRTEGASEPTPDAGAEDRTQDAPEPDADRDEEREGQ